MILKIDIEIWLVKRNKEFATTQEVKQFGQRCLNDFKIGYKPNNRTTWRVVIWPRRERKPQAQIHPWEETASSPNSKKEKLSLKKNKAEEVRPDNKSAENQGIGFGFDTIKSFFGVGAGKSSKEEKRPRVEKPLPPRRDTRETLRTPQLNAVNALFFFAFALVVVCYGA